MDVRWVLRSIGICKSEAYPEWALVVRTRRETLAARAALTRLTEFGIASAGHWTEGLLFNWPLSEGHACSKDGDR